MRRNSSLSAHLLWQEKYQEASSLRDEVSRIHMDDTSAVLRVRLLPWCRIGFLVLGDCTLTPAWPACAQVNSDFYAAFRAKDIDMMGIIWHKSATVQVSLCV